MMQTDFFITGPLLCSVMMMIIGMPGLASMQTSLPFLAVGKYPVTSHDVKINFSRSTPASCVNFLKRSSYNPQWSAEAPANSA